MTHFARELLFVSGKRAVRCFEVWSPAAGVAAASVVAARAGPPRVLESGPMAHAYPPDLDLTRVRRILATIRNIRSIQERLEAVSGGFLGVPYTVNPLIGSASIPDKFTASLAGFDCVTYIETVVALARSATVQEFADHLRNIRYAGGRIGWRSRNHYMTGWIRSNERAGYVRNLSRGPRTVVRLRVLSTLEGMSAKRARVRCFPKPEFSRLAPKIETGDLIFFASTRHVLDVFHTGILIRRGDRVLLRHASRSRAAVIEQDLAEFLRNNRMAGFIIVRPLGYN